MRYLIDTNIFIYMMVEPDKLSSDVDAILRDYDNVFYMSTKMTLNEAQGHKDPSDHIIIAQALTEKLPLISSDSRFEFYRSQGLDLVFNKK